MMSEQGTTQTQQTAPGAAMNDGLRRLVEEQVAQIEAWSGEASKLEAKSREQALAAIEEGAKLMRASLEYSGKLGAEWRRMALDGAKRTAALFGQGV